MEQKPLVAEKNIHRLFEVSILLKGLLAIIEIIGGLLLYFVSAAAMTSFVIWLAQGDLVEDPNDSISNFLLHAAQNFSVGSKTFASFYLFTHGLVKVILVAGLLRNKYWAYPSSLVVMSLFIIYQIYRYTFTHSVWLIVLTVFDLIVIWLIWHEYKLVRAHKPLE